MMPRFLTVFLAILALGSFTGLAWMLARPTPPDPQVSKLESELQNLRRENERLRQQLEQRPRMAVSHATAAGEDKTAADLAADAPNTQNKPGGLRDMMDTPGMRAMMEQQQSMQIDMGYGKLMGILQLNDEEKAHFKKLLLEREKTQTDMGLKMLDRNLTPEQKKKLVQDMQAQRKTYDDTIKAFLNDAGDYNTYREWEDSQQERLQFDMMGRSLFSSSGEPLSDQQEQQLIRMMADQRKAPSAPADISDPANLDPTQMTPAKIESYIQQLNNTHKNVQVQAASILTPGQLKTLEAFHEQTRNMARTGMQMSTMMINGGAPGR